MRRLATQLARRLPAPPDARADGDLLAGFLVHSVEDDFAELVRRHGPLVWGACRRVLPDPTDAEDAFQATFLVLVRRGRKLTGYSTIGPWLHRVAVWTARNVRRRNARRFAKRSPLNDQLPVASTDRDLSLDLDAALLALPEKFRSPIVLCHLLGFSRADAAARLGCPEGTLSAWLSRGLAKLRAKLGGLDPAKPLGLATATVPTALMSSAVRAAVASRAALGAAVSSTVSQLVDGVIRMFWVQKATAASAALVTVFALGMGIGVTARHGVGVAEGQEKSTPQPVAKPVTEIAELEAAIAKLVIYREKLLDAIALSPHANAAAWLQGHLKATEVDLKVLKGKLSKLKALSVATQDTKADEDAARIDETIAELEKKIASLEMVRDEAMKGVEFVKQKIKLYEKNSDAVPLSQRLDDLISLSRFQEHAEKTASEMQVLKELLNKLKVYKAARQNAAAKPQPKEDDHSRVELTIGGKELGIPLLYYETDKTSARVGGARVEGEALLIRLLTRARTDPTAPKTLFLNIWTDAPDDLIESTLRACQSAGYKEAIVHGRIPTNRPGIRFTPPANDPGGKRDGWFEADEVHVKFDDLLKPAEKGKK